MNRWERLARRVVLATAIGAGLLLALGMVLSYAGLRSAYLGAGFPNWAASAAPLTVDLLTLVAYVGLLVLAHKAYPGAVVAFGVLASAGGQGYHLSHGGVDARITDGWVIFALGASVMVFAGLAGHLLWLILERALPAGFITAMRAGTVFADDQPARAEDTWSPSKAYGVPLDPPLPPRDSGKTRLLTSALLSQPDDPQLQRAMADYVGEIAALGLPPLTPPVDQPAPAPTRLHAVRDEPTPAAEPRTYRPRRTGSKAPSQQPKPCHCAGDPATGRPPCDGAVVKKSTYYRHNPQVSATGGTR